MRKCAWETEMERIYEENILIKYEQKMKWTVTKRNEEDLVSNFLSRSLYVLSD